MTVQEHSPSVLILGESNVEADQRELKSDDFKGYTSESKFMKGLKKLTLEYLLKTM